MTQQDESFIRRFLRQEAASGILLVVAAMLAIILANTPLEHYYTLLIDTPVAIRIGALEIAKPLLLWVNDGFMAVFFLLVGLELKREFLEGELSDRRNIILPGLGAVGGMLIPALIYTAFNHDNPQAMHGWAIPTATDIAFALGVLTLVGSRVPVSLKVFLTSLAIFDDIGAIIIIAIFYTSNISVTALVVASICIVLLFIMNRRGVSDKSLYILVGVVMWVGLLKSGVHATLAGVILAMFIPIKSTHADDTSPLKTLEHDLHSTVAFFILPVFAFCNAGINMTALTSEQLFHNVPVGIAAGLFIGKQLGVFGFCWLAIKLGITKLPTGLSMTSLYGAAVLCGIGFTMSLFIGSLAFEESGINRTFDDRLGIIIGSVISGVLGYLILKRSLRADK